MKNNINRMIKKEVIGRLLLSSLLVAGLVSCGSGGSGEKDDTEKLKTHAKFASKIIDQNTGKPVKNVEVFIKLNDKIYQDNTDSKGNYKFYVPVVEMAGIKTVILEIYDDKYKCKVVPYESIEANRTYDLGSAGDLVLLPANILRFSDMKKACTLHHLGDDNYGGSYNSRFQIFTEGLTFGKDALKFDLNADIKTRYSSIEITFLAKGIQRRNRIELIDVGTKEVLAAVVTANSKSNGKYTPYIFKFDIDGLETGKHFFQIKSVSYDADGDHDDFEFVDFIAILK